MLFGETSEVLVGLDFEGRRAMLAGQQKTSHIRRNWLPWTLNDTVKIQVVLTSCFSACACVIWSEQSFTYPGQVNYWMSDTLEFVNKFKKCWLSCMNVIVTKIMDRG